jgi:hypothetical protein
MPLLECAACSFAPAVSHGVWNGCAIASLDIVDVGIRVCLTVGNRPGYRGNRPYRPGPVTVPAGYQPLGFKNFEFEFQKLKIVAKISKNTS